MVATKVLTYTRVSVKAQSRFPPNPPTPSPPHPPQKNWRPCPYDFQGLFGTKISTIYWEEAATLYNPDFPQSSPQGILDNEKMPAWKPSIFPMVRPKFPKFIGRPGQRKTTWKMGGLQPNFSPKLCTGNFGEKKKFPFFPQGPRGELWGKIWVENPHFPYGFLWPGWLGARHSQNLLGGPPSRPPKIWRPCPLNFQVPLWDQNSQNPLGGGGHPSHPGQR